MADTNINIEEENRKRKRINTIKNIVVGLVIVAIIVPTILCVMLFVRVTMLENDIKRLKTEAIQALAQAELMAAQINEAQTESSEEGVIEDIDQLTMPDTNKEFFEVNDVDKAADEAEVVTKEDGKKVYLTFDDGPSDNTALILDILKQYNVKATFFVIAKNNDEARQLYNRILKEGHTLAMHSYTHSYGQIYADIESYKRDVETLQQYLYETTGVKPEIYRFPGGSSNTVMNVDIQECINFLYENNITYFDWNVSSGDATGSQMTAQDILQNVLDGVNKQDEAVVLMHDSKSKDATVEALPMVIEQIRMMDNVDFFALTKDSYPVQHVKKQ